MLNRITLFLLTLILLYGKGFGQNLVPNPSFEDTVQLSNGNFDFVNWKNLLGTPDYFTPYYPSAFSNFWTPNNARGTQVPSDGVAYFGFFVYDSDRADRREYLQVELNDTLVPDKDYRVKFKISLADSFRLAVHFKDIGVSFGNTLLPNNFDHRVRTLPFISSDSSWDANDKTNWQQFDAVYTAKGGEKTLVIGNFKSDDSTIINNIQNGGNTIFFKTVSYYFIDELSVIQMDTVGLNEAELEKWMAIYPNPTKDHVYIQNKSEFPANAALYSTKGQLIREFVVQNQASEVLSLANHPSGFYFFRTNHKSGESVVKLIKY